MYLGSESGPIFLANFILVGRDGSVKSAVFEIEQGLGTYRPNSAYLPFQCRLRTGIARYD